MAPKYVERIARLPRVFELLARHPEGLPLIDLAAQVGVPVDELREDLLAFFTADLGDLLGMSRPDVLEFLGPDGEDVDPNTAEIVRIIDEQSIEELGVEHVDASELALIYTAARALLDIDPADADLVGAVDVLTETMFGAPLAEAGGARAWQRPLEPLQDAASARRKVRIVYSRAWSPGVSERVIEPYRLVQTRRSWEVDAGPPDEQGRLRTYLLSNVRDYEVLDDAFEKPDDLDAMLMAQRETVTVRVQLPHRARWVADFYAERVAAVEEDETSVTLDLELLPPVDHRVGLLMLASGLDTVVLDPPNLVATGPKLAAELLTHHRG
jgi:predicted DNA-binding transcriptional regulator YafY